MWKSDRLFQDITNIYKQPSSSKNITNFNQDFYTLFLSYQWHSPQLNRIILSQTTVCCDIWKL